MKLYKKQEVKLTLSLQINFNIKMNKFEKLGICKSILDVIKEFGFEEPTEVQEKSIPLAIQGKDVIAGASTGSGKTLAFGSAVIQNSEKQGVIKSLVLVPTRELAEQVAKELRKFSKYKHLSVIDIYGGVSITNQIQKLRKADVVVATPGRMLDHIQRNTIELGFVKTLVLDEADRMLDMGFIVDVKKIIKECKNNKQTLLFSATLSHDVLNLANKSMNNPVSVSCKSNVDPTKLDQVYYDVSDYLKFSSLVHFIKKDKSDLVMVFCNTQRNTDFVARNLQELKIKALAIHGGHTQDKRKKTIAQFHSKDVDVLVCTDVAARGLDIKEVSHVYNYDIPKEPDQYIHRIGRTARAGKKGKAISILSSRDYENFSKLKHKYPDLPLEKKELPEVQKVFIKVKNSAVRSGRGKPFSKFKNNKFSSSKTRPPRHSRDSGRSFGFREKSNSEGGYSRDRSSGFSRKRNFRDKYRDSESEDRYSKGRRSKKFSKPRQSRFKKSRPSRKRY